MTAGYDTGNKNFLWYWSMEYVRKASLALVVVLTPYQLWLQMFVLYMTCVGMIIIGGHIRVRTTRFAKGMGYFNEMKLILIMYHLMLFTDFVPAIETQDLIGFSCSATLILGTAVNMVMLVVTPSKQLILRCKIYSRKRRAKQVCQQKRFKSGALDFPARRRAKLANERSC